MSHSELPVYFPYMTHDKKWRILIGWAEFEWLESDLALKIKFDEEMLSPDEGRVPISLVYGERAERVVIGEAVFHPGDKKTELVLELDGGSDVVRMLPIARSFAIGY